MMRSPKTTAHTCLAPHKTFSRNIRVAPTAALAYLQDMPKDNLMTDQETGYHYQLMRRAIELIDDGARDLSLHDIATEMHMSPAHFQRIFSRWAGVSPKRYQQWLKLDHARDLLANRHTTLETADAVGLSGSGRLHDLFLRWEAMSPGDFAKAGAGLEILWGWFESPFGPALIMGTEKGICGIGFSAEAGAEATMTDLLSRWPHATFTEDPTGLAPLAAQAFPRDGSNREPAKLYLIGAPFQLKVWEALMQIPTGNVTTYSDIARTIGNSNAVRAVGTAVGRNPISWLIPCHRALRKSGGLGGYHWGLPVKRTMLAWEAAETA
jgi:AraC family transcriptional regulator of adaptative response/methylated-DNA-[protein]-cysteine methyltransferase